MQWGWARWLMPVIPATQEAEAGESLQPGRQRLQWAEIVPLHSGLNDIVRLSQKQNKTKQKKLDRLPVSLHLGKGVLEKTQI